MVGVVFLHISAPQNHPRTLNWGILLGGVGLESGSPMEIMPPFQLKVGKTKRATSQPKVHIFLSLMACWLPIVRAYLAHTIGVLKIMEHWQ